MDEWDELSEDFKKLEATSKKYEEKIEELNKLQQECIKQVTHQKYRLGILEKNRSIKKNEDKVVKRVEKLHQIEQTLPRSNSYYLKIILGNVNVSILNNEERLKYKSEYERFKLVLSTVSFVAAILNLIYTNRILEHILMFMLVWYYCTLTIRESILRVNGSKIHGWWRVHHALSLFMSGVLIVWPESTSWNLFRREFFVFNAYMSFIQYLQYKYQSGVLYRLKALGQKTNMDVTVDGFHSWMWRGLKFLLPFLFAAYALEMKLAHSLYLLRDYPETNLHVTLLTGLFGILSIGNCITTLGIIIDKIKVSVKVQID